MIKEKEVLIKINLRNRSHFEKLGYKIDNEIYVSVLDLFSGSKFKVTAICEVCGSEKIINFSKYLINKNRNNKCYYSCFKCKNHVKENTCLERYGVRSYSMTDEFRETESAKWKGIKKGGEKGEKTMMERYGVSSYFKTDESKEFNRRWMSSDEFKNKSKNTLLEKYGVDSYSKTDEFKKTISKLKDVIYDKSKLTFIEKYGVDWYTKSDEWLCRYKENIGNIILKNKETCLEKYGFDNVSKVEYIKEKIKKTKTEKGLVVPDHLLNDWILYKKKIRNLTKINKKQLYENWDGFDYYDNELIKGYLSYSHTHRFFPTIDHKISVYYGFINKIDPSLIGSIDNLCITKRYINSIKSSSIEEEFIKIMNL